MIVWDRCTSRGTRHWFCAALGRSVARLRCVATQARRAPTVTCLDGNLVFLAAAGTSRPRCIGLHRLLLNAVWTSPQHDLLHKNKKKNYYVNFTKNIVIYMRYSKQFCSENSNMNLKKECIKNLIRWALSVMKSCIYTIGKSPSIGT